MVVSHEARIAQLVRKLSSVTDPGLVESLARELLAERPAELLAQLLALLGRTAREDRVRGIYAGVMRLCLLPDEVPEEVRQEVYSHMAAGGDTVYGRYLLPLAPKLTSGREEGTSGDPDLDDMPLGMKKWKARGRDKEVLLRLGQTGLAPVLAILLDNPVVVEEDVIRWAARRPIPARTLLVVARHRKWSLRARIQETLARNPYAPTHVAASFLPLFTDKLLKLIAQDSSLHELVKSGASELLALRTRGGKE